MYKYVSDANEMYMLKRNKLVFIIIKATTLSCPTIPKFFLTCSKEKTSLAPLSYRATVVQHPDMPHS